MKITASRRDDIIRERDQFDAEAKARNDATEAEVKNWRNAIQEVYSRVEAAVRSQIPETSLDIQVNVRSAFTGAKDGYEVQINNQDNNPHKEGNALSWVWTVKLDRNGDVVKESNSWSGLKATNVDELQSLEDSLTVLKAINNFDWPSILSEALPEWGDYVQDRGPRPQRPKFEEQILEEDIRECIANKHLIKGTAGESSGFRAGSKVYYLVHKETPKFYVVSELAQFQMDQMSSVAEAVENAEGKYTYKITKDKFYQLIGREVEVISDEEV